MRNTFVTILGGFAAMSSASAYAIPTIPAATVVLDGTLTTANPYFYNTFTYSDTLAKANFGAAIDTANTGFNYDFNFYIPLTGKGTGSLSDNFSADAFNITISKVIVDGIDETANIVDSTDGQSLVINHFTVPGGLTVNTIEVEGYTGPLTQNGSFVGYATYTAAVPEPTTWAMFLLGFGFLGIGLRRTLRNQFKTA